MRVVEKQKRVREYRGQIASRGRPTIAWRQDRVRFWIAIAGGAKTVDAGIAAGVSEPVAHRWFKPAGAVNPQLPRMFLVGTSRRPSVRTSRCGVRKTKASEKLLVDCIAARRRCRGNCAGTRQRERTDSSTKRRQLNGTPSGVLAGPESPKWSSTVEYVSTCRTGSAVRSTPPQGKS